ncbi:MAG: hypothetical protein MI743_05060 [Sneathiellales bacterium]|nr:hypothetical protein [Sneathiellales bacterium]
MTRKILLLSLTALAALSSPSLFAEEATFETAFTSKGAIPVPSSGKEYPSYFLTPAQLEKCLGDEEQMASIQSYLKKRDALFVQLRKKIDNLNSDIAAVETYFKENPNTKIDDKENFEKRNRMVRKNNALVEDYNKTLEEYDKVQAAYNSDVEEFNSLSRSFEQNCRGKRYYSDDLKALRADQ